MRRRMIGPLVGTVVGVLSVLTSACGSTLAAPVVRQAAAGAPYHYVAVGGSDATGGGTDDPLLDAWPQQLFRTAMPLSAVLVNAAVPNETVAQARVDQVATALASSPKVVTVWLVSGDLLAGTSPATFRAELLALLTALRDRGGTTVLVGTAPPLDQVPGYRACRDGTAPPRLRCPTSLPDRATLELRLVAYDASIVSDAAASGAVVVDLQTPVARSVATDSASFLVASGADLSLAGSTVVADAFGSALPTALHVARLPAPPKTGSGS